MATDPQGEHYIDPDKVHYNDIETVAYFYLITNEFIPGTQNLKGTSFTTQYVIYCHPSPRMYERWRIRSFSKLWGKGKRTDSFTLHSGSWNIEEPKELLISEYVCKEKRMM